LSAADDVCLIGVCSTFDDLRVVLRDKSVSVVLVDVTQGTDYRQVGELATEFPELAVIALGLQEQASFVINAGKFGFSGYVARDATLTALLSAIRDAAAGRLMCSGEVAGHLLRALFQQLPSIPGSNAGAGTFTADLTRRERDVARLIGQGFSNKEIARDLCVSLATVKHHVHHVLEKLRIHRRSQVLGKLGEAPSKNGRGFADHHSTTLRSNSETGT
jgi:DNA-binding NarL/FixJ family response regulator